MLRLAPPHGRAFGVSCLVLLALLPLALLYGQSTTGVIGGSSLDPQHAVLANARIVALNEATGAEFIVYSDKSRLYVGEPASRHLLSRHQR